MFDVLGVELTNHVYNDAVYRIVKSNHHYRRSISLLVQVRVEVAREAWRRKVGHVTDVLRVGVILKENKRGSTFSQMFLICFMLELLINVKPS